MSATATAIADENYLTAGFSLRSWLTSTHHKRIAILYGIAITVFFFVGGAAATLIRLELVTPAGDLVTAETYSVELTVQDPVDVERYREVWRRASAGAQEPSWLTRMDVELR